MLLALLALPALPVSGAGDLPPPIVFIADGREGADECAALTLFARILAGEIALTDLQDPAEPPPGGTEGGKDALCERFRQAALPAPGEKAPSIAAVAGGREAMKAVAGRLEAPRAICILLDPRSGEVLARAAAGPSPAAADDFPIPPARSALAGALGELLGRSFTPLEVALAGLETSRRSGEAIGAEGTAMALLSRMDDPRLHRIIALAKEARGDPDGARLHWSEALRGAAAHPNPDSAAGDWVFRAGLARMEEKLGDPVSAASQYERALESCPQEVRPRLLAARGAVEKSRRVEEERRAAWQEALRRAERLHGEAAARARKRADEEAAALRIIEERLRISPDDLPARLARGERHLKDRRFSAARSDFARAVEIDPRSGAARLALGRSLLLEAGRAGSEATAARAALEEAARLLPGDPEPLVLLGDLLAAADGGPVPRWSEHRGGIPAFDLEAWDRPAGAGGAEASAASPEFYRRALDLAPEDARVLSRVADEAEGATALRLARRAVEIGGYPDARRVLGSALRQQGKLREAERELALFLGEAARSAIERERALRRLRSLGLRGAAERVSVEGLGEDPAGHGILFESARLRFETGRPAEAISDFRTALVLAAGGLAPEKFAPAQVAELAEMLLSRSRPEEARAELTETLRRLAAEEARLRATRLPAADSPAGPDLTRPRSRRQEPVDFGNARDRAAWARLRLSSGRVRKALGDREGAREDLRWAARVVAVERGRVRPEAEWPAALSAPAREIAAESVALLAALAAEDGDRAAASALETLAQNLRPAEGRR